MGNQPSAPAPGPPPPPPPPPPLPIPPPCDLECQRQKQLTLLETALNQAAQNKNTDPETYEQARISYFTLLNGQSWLDGEKLRIAKQEIEPLISEYSTKFNNLKGEKKMNSIFENLAGALKAQQASDEQDNGFLQQQLNSETDRLQILNRLNELTAPQGGPSYSYIPFFLNILMVLFGLFIAYLLYQKSGTIMSYFSGSTETYGGRRK
jgi:hypothetical protein